MELIAEHKRNIICHSIKKVLRNLKLSFLNRYTVDKEERFFYNKLHIITRKQVVAKWIQATVALTLTDAIIKSIYSDIEAKIRPVH